MDSGKCSLHRRRATIRYAPLSCNLLFALGLVTAAALGQDTTGSSQPSGDSAVTVAEQKLEAFNESVHSLTATFTQETWSVDNRLVDEASGTFALLRPGKFIWHTLTPYEHLVIADGQTIWMYDVELEQVTKSDAGDLPAANPGMLLSGDRSVREDYDIGGTYQLDDREFIELRPKDERADFSRILVAFRDTAPEAIEIVDGLNQTTRIEFGDLEINSELSPSRFEFEPPRGVNVIGGER